MLSYALLVVLASDNFDRTAVKMHFTIPRMIATSSFDTALEYTKFVFGRGFASDSAGGAYSAPPDRLAGLRGPYF